MDDFHIITNVESLIVCCCEYNYAIFNIYILLLAVDGVYMLDT
jgi:hypothetical protein